MSNASKLHGYAFEVLRIGQTASLSRTITEADLRNFSGVSGDTNPMHLNEEYARNAAFGGIIVHGMLTASLLSATIGTKLPGPGCIYMSQTLKFLAPVHVNDTVYATVTITALKPEKRHVTLSTECHVGQTCVISGEALVKVPQQP